jgi:hypothetical protein
MTSGGPLRLLETERAVALVEYYLWRPEHVKRPLP